MDDKTISISVTADEESFIADQIAAGNYADEKELLRAGLAVLEREAKVGELRRLIAEGDADIAAGRVHAFASAGDMTRHIIELAKSRKR